MTSFQLYLVLSNSF